MPRAWISRVDRSRGGLALCSVGVLMLSLLVRNELPLPPAPSPAPVQFDVVVGSPGVEQSDTGPFWTIVQPTASVRAINIGEHRQIVDAALDILAGPCDTARTVEVSWAGRSETAELEPGAVSTVHVDDLILDGISAVSIDLVVTAESCPPLGSDPRSVYMQVWIDFETQPNT